MITIHRVHPSQRLRACLPLVVASIALAGWLLSALLPSVAAQTAKPKPEPAAPKAQLKIPVWVETANNEFWQEGKRQSFKAYLNEKEVAVKNLQGPQNATVLLVVFDTVVDLNRVEIARNELAERLKGLGETYWIGVLNAQDGLAVLQEPTANRTALVEKIQSIQVNGRAGLIDTLEPLAKLATSMLQKAGVRVSVLYVTDSGVANYRADMLNPVINSSDSGDLSRRFADRAVQERMSALAQNISAYTIPFFIMHLEYRADTLNLAYQSGLERIAADSGGQALFCRTNDEIAPGLDSLLTRIKSQYVITIDSPNTKRPTAKLKIEALDTNNQPFEKVQFPAQVIVKRK